MSLIQQLTKEMWRKAAVKHFSFLAGQSRCKVGFLAFLSHRLLFPKLIFIANEDVLGYLDSRLKQISKYTVDQTLWRRENMWPLNRVLEAEFCPIFYLSFMQSKLITILTSGHGGIF